MGGRQDNISSKARRLRDGLMAGGDGDPGGTQAARHCDDDSRDKTGFQEEEAGESIRKGAATLTLKKYCDSLFLDDELIDAIMREPILTEYEEAFGREPSRSERVRRVLYKYFKQKGDAGAK